jgi:hypothetical protein
MFDEIYEKYFDTEFDTLKWEHCISTKLTFKDELVLFRKKFA